MDRRKDKTVEAVLEQLIETGPTDIASVFARAFELAMQIERERFLGAGHYERTPERRGYANATLPKRIDTPAGTVNVQGPKTAGHEGERLSPQSLERGRRSVRAFVRKTVPRTIFRLFLTAGGGGDVHQGVRRVGKRSSESFSRRTDA